MLDKGLTQKETISNRRRLACLSMRWRKAFAHGYLPASYLRVAQKGYRGIVRDFLKTDANGQLNLEGTVNVGGLGGNPYRDGSYEYYLSEKVVTNDPKGIGALLLAATEMEIAAEKKVKLKQVSYYK